MPDALAHPIKRAPERARREPPLAYLDVKVDGRESSYFEWLGAGLYATDRRSSAMHGRAYVLGDFYYGFGPDALLSACRSHRRSRGGNAVVSACGSRCGIRAKRALPCASKTASWQAASSNKPACACLHPETVVSAAYGKILEVGLRQGSIRFAGRRELLLSVALWKGGLPLDVLPAEGMMSVALGEEYFAWPIAEKN